MSARTLSSGSTQVLPFSITATFSCGKRDSAPWQMSADTASSTGRHDDSIRKACGSNGSISLSLPIHSLAWRS